MKIVAIKAYGEFTAPLRNIRCVIDGSLAAFELIPEALSEVTSQDLDETPPAFRDIVAGSRKIVEAPTRLRLEFEDIMGVAVDMDIDVDLFGGLHDGWSTAPKLKGRESYYPLLEIENSPWKAQIPDWRGGDDPAVKHVRMISAEGSFDLLGKIVRAEWRPNKNPDAD